MKSIFIAERHLNMEDATFELMRNHLMEVAKEKKILYGVALDAFAPDGMPFEMYERLRDDFRELDHECVMIDLGDYEVRRVETRYDACLFWETEKYAKRNGCAYVDALKEVQSIYDFTDAVEDMTPLCEFMDGTRNTLF